MSEKTQIPNTLSHSRNSEDSRCAGLILRFSHVGAGLRALSLVSRFEGVHSLCSFANGSEFSIVLGSESQNSEQCLMAFFKEISNVGLLRSKFFPKWNPEVEKAFFKLTNNQISPDGCLIAESDDLGSLFEWGHEAAEKGLKIVEFSFPRSSKPWGYLALTGEKDALDSINLKNCDLITRLECTTSIQDYF